MMLAVCLENQVCYSEQKSSFYLTVTDFSKQTKCLNINLIDNYSSISIQMPVY